MARVEIVVGSENDIPALRESGMLGVFDRLQISCNVSVVSAHRNPEDLRAFCAELPNRRAIVCIAVAGMAAELPGAIAAWVRNIPILGVALDAGLGGLDALLSITRMPPGVPVACMGIGKAGLYNAAIFAAQINACYGGDPEDRLLAFIDEETGKKPAKIDFIKSERSE